MLLATCLFITSVRAKFIDATHVKVYVTNLTGESITFVPACDYLRFLFPPSIPKFSRPSIVSSSGMIPVEEDRIVIPPFLIYSVTVEVPEKLWGQETLKLHSAGGAFPSDLWDPTAVDPWKASLKRVPGFSLKLDVSKNFENKPRGFNPC